MSTYLDVTSGRTPLKKRVVWFSSSRTDELLLLALLLLAADAADIGAAEERSDFERS